MSRISSITDIIPDVTGGWLAGLPRAKRRAWDFDQAIHLLDRQLGHSALDEAEADHLIVSPVKSAAARFKISLSVRSSTFSSRRRRSSSCSNSDNPSGSSARVFASRDLLDPVPQRALRDPERTGHLGDRSARRRHERERIPAELLRLLRWTAHEGPFLRCLPRNQVSKKPGRVQ